MKIMKMMKMRKRKVKKAQRKRVKIKNLKGRGEFLFEKQNYKCFFYGLSFGMNCRNERKFTKTPFT
jgi:hypothetical protein